MNEPYDLLLLKKISDEEYTYIYVFCKHLDKLDVIFCYQCVSIVVQKQEYMLMMFQLQSKMGRAGFEFDLV